MASMVRGWDVGEGVGDGGDRMVGGGPGRNKDGLCRRREIFL